MEPISEDVKIVAKCERSLKHVVITKKISVKELGSLIHTDRSESERQSDIA